MEKVTISAAAREGIGVKGALSKIRAEKNIPAVVYGGHKEPVSVTVSVKDLEKIIKAGKNTLVELSRQTGTRARERSAISRGNRPPDPR